jgi:DNA modification methylase
VSVYEGHGVTLHHADCLDVLRSLPDCSVDSVVCDPPYALGFMGREWDTFGMDVGRGAQARSQRRAEVTPTGEGHSTSAGPYLASGVDSLRAAGLPFQRWCEAWATECLRVLKPGGHLLAFGGTRTWHRLACAVEDAGFEVRDSIAWLYGSGFPKSLDVSKAIDKRPGVGQHPEFALHLAERREAAGLSRADVSERVVGTRTGACWNWEHHQFPEAKWWPALRDLLDLDDAKWGPVIAEAERQKIGTRTADRLAVAPGQGADRSAVDLDITTHATPDAERWQGWGTALKPAFEPVVVARKPLIGTVAANVLAHGTGALNVDGCRVEGDVPSVPQPVYGVRDDGVTDFGSGVGRNGQMSSAPGGRWPANVVLDESQAEALDEQSGTTQARIGKPRGADSGEGWGMTATGAEYDDLGGASRFFYVAKADASERPRVNGTAHPTVKPLSLMRWLVRLVTPPGGTVLEPFAGSGTTVEACIIEGFQCIAIEREADYLPLIRQRIDRRRDPVSSPAASPRASSTSGRAHETPRHHPPRDTRPGALPVPSLRHLAHQEVRARHSLLHRLPVCRADPTEAVVMAHDQNQPIEAVLDAIGIIPIQSLLIDLLPTERILVRFALCSDYIAACEATKAKLGAREQGRGFSADSHADYSAEGKVGAHPIVLRHTCFPHLPCWVPVGGAS